MRTSAYVAQSIDGYIATPDGGVGWLDAYQGEDLGYDEFVASVDAIVMGRNTYETVLSFGIWPYGKPVVVLSSRSLQVPSHLEGKVSQAGGEIRTILDSLEERGYRHLYVDGGKTIQSFLEQDLIDTMTITTVPILLGSGIPLFGTLGRELQFILTDTKITDSGLAMHTYGRAPARFR